MVHNSSYLMLCMACFIAGAVSIPLIGVMTCYVSELTSQDMMYVVIGACFFAEAWTSIFVGLYFKYYKDCAVFYLLITISMAFFLVFYAAFAKESPHFLFKTRRFDECLDHLRLMGRWNGYTGYPQLPTVGQMRAARDNLHPSEAETD